MEIDPNHWFRLQLLEINLVLDKFLRINSVITQFWVTPKFCFPFLKKKKPARCRFERHCATSSPLQMQRQGRMRFLKTFPANFSFSLLPLAHKTRTQPIPPTMTKRRPCPAAAAQEPSRATMPCTWTGYGASPPAAYKYRGEHRKQGEEDDFF